MYKNWVSSSLNCEAYSSLKVCYPITELIRLSLRRNTTQTAKITFYDWSLLNSKDISDKYTITRRNKFNALQEISDTLIPNDEYENFVIAHIEAAAECIPTKLGARKRVP